MRFKKLFVALFGMTIIFSGCSDNVVADFTYSPSMPKCGQKVLFTNISTGDEEWEGEYWNWTFGDDTKSVAKNPSHIYQKPGIYTVTLQVDSNKHYLKTLDITVYDSIPTIYADVDSVKYYENVNFSALIYNPDNLDITYAWTFSENAQSTDLVNRKSNKESVDVFFNKKQVSEIVRLSIKLGNVKDSIVILDTFYVHDVKVKSLLMAQQGGKILRQRIFEKGFENYSATTIDAGKHALNIAAYSNQLYIFDAGTKTSYQADWLTNTAGDGKISVTDMGNNTTKEIINNNGKSSHFGFFNGFVDNNNIYWTDYSEFIYKTPKNSTLGNFDWKGSADAQTASPYYLTKSDRLGYFGNGLASNQFTGGICYYDQVYFWAKGGSGKGIYRFQATDILTANTTGTAPIPSLGAILTDYAIRAFTLDQINQKIYFSVTAPADKIGFWVANISGTGAKRIDDAPVDNANLYITGIAVDNESNTVYWAYRSPETAGASAPAGTWESYYSSHPTHRTGIKKASLATNFKPAGEITYFAPGVSAYGIALDEVKK
ncbi:MAG TPA: PKD domain-containing protein [Paludibacter sp.]|nr:PKD domain-containing protein [Paludibacter sp.]